MARSARCRIRSLPEAAAAGVGGQEAGVDHQPFEGSRNGGLPAASKSPDMDETVDEAGDESFPASDAPQWWSGEIRRTASG